MAFKSYIFVSAFILCNIANGQSGNSVDFRGAFDEDLYESVIDEELCDQQLTLLLNHSLRWDFLDASAKIPSGINSGNVNDFGDYYQCLDIDEIVDDMVIEGKYCAITAPLDQNPIIIPDIPEIPEIPEIPWPPLNNETKKKLDQVLTIQRYASYISGLNEPIASRMFPMVVTIEHGMTLGICIPKVCSPTQAIDFVQDNVSFLNFTYQEFYCRLPNDKPFSPADYVAVVIFGLIGLLALISTIYDLQHIFIQKRDPSKANPLYQCFSMYTNTRRILTFKSIPGTLECMDGIRAISMMWVVIGHTYALSLVGYVHNSLYTLEWLREFSSTWVNSAPLVVDSFFLLSGILAVYTTIGKISRARFITTLPMFYLNRLLRMFPLLAAVVLLHASVFNHVSDGPFWQNVALVTENCRAYWWTTLLHVQNYVNKVDLCLPQTWYLSVDIQLYIVCPLVIVWLFGTKPIAWFSLCFIISLSLVSSSLYSYLFNFSAALVHPGRLEQLEDYWATYYVNTLARAPPFFIGMAYGYILHMWRGRKARLPMIYVAILWILAFVLMAFCVFSIYPVMQLDHDKQMFDNFLNAYMRAIWALALGWLIFACHKGYGGPINWFLSLQMWKLPARLSYAIYLLHFPIIMIANGSWLKTHYFTNGDNIYRFMSDLSISFVSAFVLSIFIDAPFSTLQKMLLGGGKKRPPAPKPKTESRQNIVEDDTYIKTTL